MKKILSLLILSIIFLWGREGEAFTRDLILLEPFLKDIYILTEDLQKLRKAKDKLEFGFAEEALEILDTVQDSAFSDWKNYFKGKALLQLGKEDLAFQEWEKIKEDSPAFYLSRKEAVEELKDLQLRRSALVEIESFKGRDYPFYLYYKGLLFNSRFHQYLFCNYPLSEYAEKVKAKRTAECRISRAKVFIRNGIYSRALKELRYVRGDKANYYKARAYYGLRRYRLALKKLNLIRKKTTKELLLTLRCLIRLGWKNQIERLYARIEKLYPLSRTHSLALWYRANFYLPEEKGVRLLEEFIKKFPQAPEWDEAIRRLFWLNFLKSREKAFEIYEKYHNRIKDLYVKITLDYWYGKENDPGIIESLAKNYPVTYYGMKSLEIIGLPFPQMAPPYFEIPSSREFELHFKKAQLLYSVNMLMEARAELKYLQEKFPYSNAVRFALGIVEYEMGNSIKGIRLMRQALNHIYPRGIVHPDLMRRVYPFPFRELLKKMARRNQLDPYLVAALIHQESAFQPSAISTAGAIGLMQVMPYTHSAIIKRMGLGNKGREKLFDILHNMQVGIYHLRELLNLFDSEVKALAAYNAGVEVVKEWINLYGNDDELFIESIPYRETRNYVKNILLKKALYRRLYSHEED